MSTIFEILAAGGGGAAVAFLIFRFLGASWIDNRFARSLEDHRHAQARDLQELRIAIDSMLSRTLKLQEKEFEVLPEAWRRLHAAYSRVLDIASPGQSYPGLDEMTTEQIDEFLEGSKLYESQKKKVRNSNEKVIAYSEEIYWHRLHDVKVHIRELYNYVVGEGIFLERPLKQEFDDIADDLWNAVSSMEIGKRAQDFELQRDSWRELQEKVKPRYETIQELIHSRLRAQSAT